MICLAILVFVIGFCVIAYNVEHARKDWLGILGYLLCISAAAIAGYFC